MMTLLDFDREWLRALRASAEQAPLRPRVPLWAGDSVIGSVEPDFFHKIVLQPLIDGPNPLLKEEHRGQPGWCLMGDVTGSLKRVAAALHAARLSGVWRHEQLAVTDALGQRKGTVERAAVRPLGIATLAVHLVGRSPEGRFWVQQRAHDKAVDPSLWDTLMGGMVAAADTVESALARETWEEAGLRLSALQDLRYGGRLNTCRPCGDGKGAGYVSERVDWYCCSVPAGQTPINQDGEVEQFRLLDSDQLLGALQQGRFTTEAALILADVMGLP
jgi:8-oxo-dGTP pyrophosphatase MutT (NUDIX family)